MSIIIVSGLPPRWDMKLTVRKLTRKIKGQFEALTIKCFKNQRKCFIRLSELLNPQQVVQNINNSMFGPIKLHAYIPDETPDLPRTVKPKGIPFKLRRALRIAGEATRGEVLYAAHTELLAELQLKYAGLYNLSMKEDHELLKKISKILLDQLWSIMESSDEEHTAYKLTTAYRKKYHHNNDFQMIVSTLNSIEEALGKSPTQLNREEFMKPNSQPHLIGNISFNKVQDICRKYSKSIGNAIVNHTNNLDTEPIPEPTEEQAATLKVRQELKNMGSYLPLMIIEVINDHFVQKRVSQFRIRIYGEPYLPNRETISPFLKKFSATKIFRSDRIHNLLCCKVSIGKLGAMLDADGTLLGRATLFVRLSDVELYKVPESMRNKMLSFNTDQEHQPETSNRMEDEWNENW